MKSCPPQPPSHTQPLPSHKEPVPAMSWRPFATSGRQTKDLLGASPLLEVGAAFLVWGKGKQVPATQF